MLNLKAYMKKVGVTKEKYVLAWVEQDLIPGVIKGKTISEFQFPDSARRPYRDRWLKAGIGADQIRAHIIKACLSRQHITYKSCFASAGEFEGFINELEAVGLVQKRIEDGITYFDSTLKSEAYKGKKLSEIKKFILEAIKASSEGIAKGTTAAILEKVAS